MTKYSEAPLGEMRHIRARVDHVCMVCGANIPKRSFYFKEHSFLRFLSRPLVEICESCFAAGKLPMKLQRSEREGPLDRF